MQKWKPKPAASSLTPRIYMSRTLNSLFFLHTVIYIDLHSVQSLHSPPGRRCGLLLILSRGQLLGHFENISLEGVCVQSIWTGLCLAVIHTFCRWLLLRRDKGENKNFENQSLNKKFNLFSGLISSAWWLWPRYMHISGGGLSSQPAGGFCSDTAVFKGQSSSSDTCFSIPSLENVFFFRYFFKLPGIVDKSLLPSSAAVFNIYVHPWYPWLALMTCCCGDSVWVGVSAGECSLVTGNIIAVGVRTAVSWFSACLWAIGPHASRWWSPGESQNPGRAPRSSPLVGRAAVPPDTSDTAAGKEQSIGRVTETIWTAVKWYKSYSLNIKPCKATVSFVRLSG